jgi:hypothetical protein
MGNRGALQPTHFEREQPYASKAWITCVLKDQDNVPIPASPVKYTKLFFLDEVTALAAGHRPCGQCQRKHYDSFVEAWTKVTSLGREKLDAHLQTERCDVEDDGKRPVVMKALGNLPSGSMVMLERNGAPHLLLWGKVFPWSAGGYGRAVTISMGTEVQLLTPPSIVQMLQAGFPLAINRDTTVHPSIFASLS